MVIYKIKNTINSKIYIGQTCRDPKIRKREHFNLKNCSSRILKEDIKSFGVSAFSFEVIESCSSFEDLNKMEEFFIKENDCLHPNGYNLIVGAPGCKVTQETRNKMSESRKGDKNPMYGKTSPLKGKKLSPRSIEHCLNISLAKRGKKPTMTKESKRSKSAKLSKALKGKNKTWLNKPVLCVNNGIIYDSPKYAAMALNLNRNSISRVASGRNKSIFGYKFKYT